MRHSNRLELHCSCRSFIRTATIVSTSSTSASTPNSDQQETLQLEERDVLLITTTTTTTTTATTTATITARLTAKTIATEATTQITTTIMATILSATTNLKTTIDNDLPKLNFSSSEALSLNLLLDGMARNTEFSFIMAHIYSCSYHLKHDSVTGIESWCKASNASSKQARHSACRLLDSIILCLPETTTTTTKTSTTGINRNSS